MILELSLIWNVSLQTQPGLQGVRFGSLQSPCSGRGASPPHSTQPAISFLPPGSAALIGSAPHSWMESLQGAPALSLLSVHHPFLLGEMSQGLAKSLWVHNSNQRHSGMGEHCFQCRSSSPWQEVGHVLLLQAVLWGLNLSMSPFTRKKKITYRIDIEVLPYWFLISFGKCSPFALWLLNTPFARVLLPLFQVPAIPTAADPQKCGCAWGVKQEGLVELGSSIFLLKYHIRVSKPFFANPLLFSWQVAQFQLGRAGAASVGSTTHW